MWVIRQCKILQFENTKNCLQLKYQSIKKYELPYGILLFLTFELGIEGHSSIIHSNINAN